MTGVKPPPDVFAAVMATGIVSIAAADHHYRWISDVLAAMAMVSLPVLVVVTTSSWRRNPLDCRDPDVMVRLFTYVAACAVLGGRFAEHRIVLWVLTALALHGWLSLAPVVVHRMWGDRWTGLRDRARGAWELASVGTSAVAAVFADLHWLVPALLFWAIAILLYCGMTGLILWRTTHERLDRDGFEPDSWILMGGLAIATLAGDHIHRLWPVGVVEVVTIVTWVVATLWIPPLVYFGLRRINRWPESRQFAGIWWAMVFPLGMYSAATFAMAAETGWASLTTVSLVFCWVGIAAWLGMAVAGLTALLRFVTAQRR